MSCDGSQLLMLAALQLRAAFDVDGCCIRQRVITVISCIIIKRNRAFDNVVATLKGVSQ
jgi:phospholipase C